MSDWNAFAAREPYFAVLTHPRFLRANFDVLAETEFFQSGEAYVADLLPFLQTRVTPRFEPQSVLEYGCGAGRLAIPFARRTPRVTAVDVAPAMLETAGQQAGRHGVTNIEFVDVPTFEKDERTFDLVNCYLVLQRISPAQGLPLLGRLARRVRPGGIGVFQLPYRARISPLVRLSRSARLRVPGVNALANLARHKPAGTPLIAAHTYDLGEVFALLHEAGFEAPVTTFVRQGELDGVVIHARRKPAPEVRPLDDESARAAASGTGDAAHFIDVRRLIAGTSVEQLNRTAEEYFASLKDWEHHLAKPFARVEDTPQLLIGLGVLLQGLELTPGMTVLEFGSGTGWLARYLTQLGCRMILLDVSPTALKIARELFAKQPVFGNRPEPQFLPFDARHIDLPDHSVDRILCFDSFHHSTDPDAILAEFARLLKPGGIAGFAEPGPFHSKTPQSQFEMRTYGVVENDVDIHAIWETSKNAGFVDLRVAAFNIPPFHVSLAEFDELLAGGDAYVRWAESTRSFLTGNRTFFLRMAGREELDSRKASGLHATIEASLAAPPVAGQPIRIRTKVANSGRAAWLPSAEDFGGVSIGAHLYDAEGKLVAFDYGWQHLPEALTPGGQLELEFDLPPLAAGHWTIELDCVANHVAWFTQTGSPAKRIDVESRPTQPPSSRA
jgi:ubiquinone/menaquinone biosynthesis C-methylase UbiE